MANETSQTVFRIDARTAQPQATIPVTGHISADDLAVGEARSSRPVGPGGPGDQPGRRQVPDRVTRIDMATNRVAGTFQVGGRAPAAVVGLGSVWVVDTNHAALLRLQPTA